MASPIPTRSLNLVFLGEKHVGKTALINRIMQDAPMDPKFRVSVDKTLRLITVQGVDKSLELHLIDTSGRELSRDTIDSYIHHSSIFIVVYDVTNAHSFRVTSKWVDIVRTEHGEDAIISLVGNKIEQSDAREVTTEEGQQRADELNTLFIETSAVAGPNVTLLFHRLVMAILKKERQRELIEQLIDDEEEYDAPCFIC